MTSDKTMGIMVFRIFRMVNILKTKALAERYNPKETLIWFAPRAPIFSSWVRSGIQIEFERNAMTHFKMNVENGRWYTGETVLWESSRKAGLYGIGTFGI
jgi:hypothetical protein